MIREFTGFNNLNINEKSDFSIFFRSNKVYISKKNISLNKWLYILKIECEILDVSFPYDLSRGTAQLKNNRTKLSLLEGYLKEETIKELFENHPQKEKYQNIELNFDKNSISVKGIYNINTNDSSLKNNYLPFLFKIGVYIKNDRLFLVLLEDYILGTLPSLRYKFIQEFFDIPNINNHSLNIYSIKIFPALLDNLFPVSGYKIPNYKNTLFRTLDIENSIIRFSLADTISKDLSPIPAIKDTLATLEIYKENEELFYKLLNDEISNSDISQITDIKNISKDRVKQKLFIEFLENSFASVEILKTLSERNINDDIMLDIAIKLANFDSKYRFEEIINKLIVKLKKENKNNILEIIYIYMGYYHKNNNSSKSILYFEKLWNINRNYLYIWKDFFDELIKYENYFLAVEIGEFIAPKVSDEEYFWEKIGDIFSNNIQNYNKALEYYTRVLRISPELIMVKLKILDLYALQEKNLFAIDRLNQLLDENRSNLYLKLEIDKRLAKLWYKEQHFERAIFHIEQALKEHKNPELYYMAYESSQKMQDDLRAFEYLKLGLNYYENYQPDKDSLYYKISSDIAEIHLNRGELFKAYEHLILIPKEYLSLNTINSINNLLIKLNKKEELFKYMELKEKLLDKREEKIKFWKENLSLFKNKYPDIMNEAKSALNLALLSPENDDFFYNFEELKHILKDNEILYKIMKLYNKRAKLISDKLEKGDLYYKIFKMANALNNKALAYKTLKTGLKESPQHRGLKLIYKKWLDDKKRY